MGAVITTYASARLHLDDLPEDRFQMLILDEAHKLRNLYGVESAPQVAKKFRQALQDRRFRYVLMLTATPIHNRLWDLYSLVDLLTVARGHQNPFGSEGVFARKFIADGREQARHLKQNARDEFRSIVYGYMSRVRRGDAKLYFPEREVQMHRVAPTDVELHLIKAIARPIQDLNPLAQISILQALVSSPDALMAQLNNMARNGTVPASLAALVRSIVVGMPLSAKLLGLNTLIEQLKRETPDRWRLVVFTTRIETQTTIQNFLETNGLKVGIINGTSGPRNQETLARFRADPPDCHVIVSTEAGAEGVNLQVANVLVNYDLPWNPMIVEQRIGRVQRLASKHAKVGIFNIILKGTFEEYIVGRLMEKLQMASQAIGDLEALLDASGVDDDDEASASFEERIRKLVVEALTGKDMELETRRAEESIANARKTLESEQATINDLLDRPDGKEYVGPRAPKLPTVTRSLSPKEFRLRGLKLLGARISEFHGRVSIQEDGAEEFVHFEGESALHPQSTLYAPGTPSFARLVNRLVATGIHDVRDSEQDPYTECKRIAGAWTEDFGVPLVNADVHEVQRRFSGTALVRVRATVAHDSYERLVDIECSNAAASDEWNKSFLYPVGSNIGDPRAVGLSPEHISSAAELDDGIAEFCRFYDERLELELKAAGDDERKRKKLEDDFTPRLNITLVGLVGDVRRDVKLNARYKIDGREYSSVLTVRPADGRILDAPAISKCSKTGHAAPITCLAQCHISNAYVLKHVLVTSEKSGRSALPEFTVACGLTGKRLLQTEAEQSSVTGKLIDKALLKTSAITGSKGEPEYFARCEFTGAEALATELARSEISGRLYRPDQHRKSVVSGKTGHKDEFVACAQTGHSLAHAEAAKCDVSGAYAKPGILQRCEVTGKRVLPNELERCAVTGKCALKSLLVRSSISGIRLLEEVAIRSALGEFCAPAEARACAWSAKQTHPSDLRTCTLTRLNIRQEFVLPQTDGFVLQALRELLDGVRRSADKRDMWESLATKAAHAVGKGRCQVEAAILSPNGLSLASSIEVKTMLGLKTRQAGVLFNIHDGTVLGHVAQGQRKGQGWVRA